ncbi:MAG: galactose-1-phosphate uridylyltransferase [Spirochaetes bacterium GWF1_51_8]|nr:MAG: galactose-1-phosphate uridylyltransferase [Spirochaetes bacterium GWF1_51_8]
MAELRWNPLLGTYTMVAANRQQRPDLPADWCAFCPGPGKKVPSDYDVFMYENDFPVMKPDADTPDEIGGELYPTLENHGKCEVILYSPRHDAHLCTLSQGHIRKLVDLWCERNSVLSEDPKVKYVFIFENRGREVGATMSHPHGQLYAYPFVPQKIDIELANCRAHYDKKGSCLICDMNREELRFGKRVIGENNGFYYYLPAFTDYPYGVFITAKRHFGNFAGMTFAERDDLALALKNVTGMFDTLFEKPFPYMMCIHQTPCNMADHGDFEKYYHFHIEFYPPLRSADRIKFYASSELGAWAAANPLRVEDTAIRLREALAGFLGSGK